MNRRAEPALGEMLVLTNNRRRVFQRNIIAGAEEVGRAKGYRLEVLEVPRPADPAVEAEAAAGGPAASPHWTSEPIEHLAARGAAILLIADVLPDGAVATLHDSGVPLTLVSHRVPGIEVPSIMHDNIQGIELLTGEILDRGRRGAPVFVRGSSRQRDGAERETAFRRELLRRGLPIDEGRFLDGEFEPEQAAAALTGFLAGGGELDSLVAADYLMAIACLGVLRANGLDAPDDVAVAGFGDGPEAHAAGLTTVAADVVELGRRAARQLLGQREGLEIRGLTLLSTNLIRRTSSG